MDLIGIGRRIEQARIKKGRSYAELARALGYKESGKGEIVRLWARGESPPPLDRIADLARELDLTEEFLLFEIRRNEQLQAERPVLQHVYQDESDLLTLFRRTATAGRKLIMNGNYILNSLAP